MKVSSVLCFMLTMLVQEYMAQTRCNFFKEKNKILVGYSTVVVTAANLFDCHSQCIDSMSKFGFKCQSGMFYPQEGNASGNCLLNVKNKKDKPDLYVDESDNVIYFEPECL